MAVQMAVRDLDSTRDGFSLKGITLNVDEGEIVLVGGKNGSGKTTLLETLCLVNTPRSGTIDYLGQTVFDDHINEKNLQRIKAHLGVKFQGDDLFKNLTVYEILRLFSENYEGGDLDKLISECPPVEDILDKRASRLSEGEEQLTKFLLSIAHEPELVMLDEPVSNLDEIAKDWVYEKIKELKSKGSSFLITLNELWKIGEISEKLMVLENGRKTDTIKEFRKFKKGCVVEIPADFDVEILQGEDWILDIEKNGENYKIYSKLESEETLKELESPIIKIRDVKLSDFYSGAVQ